MTHRDFVSLRPSAVYCKESMKYSLKCDCCKNTYIMYVGIILVYIFEEVVRVSNSKGRSYSRITNDSTRNTYLKSVYVYI